MTSVWERRRHRAGELRRLWPFARQSMDFIIEVLDFQRALAARLPERLPEDPAFLAASMPPLLELAARHGPGELAVAARRWMEQSPEIRGEALRSFWRRETTDGARAPAADLFARAVLQPYAMALESSRAAGAGGAAEDAAAAAATCPVCAHPPGLSILREDGASGAVERSLACSLCAREWSFARIRCPACLEERPGKLPRYSAEDFPWLRIEACAACGRYLKAIDLAKSPAAEPTIDELASIPLDLIARHHGHTKLTPNLTCL
jgi:hypothetical protein